MILSPIGNSQVYNVDGTLLVGGKIWTYLEGTTTTTVTYGDKGGVTVQTNPIILNTFGLPDQPIWLQEGRRYKFVFMDDQDNLLWTYDNIQGINDFTVGGAGEEEGEVEVNSEWIQGDTGVYQSANSFYLAGDKTAIYHKFRRVKLQMLVNFVYGYISKTSYDTELDRTDIEVTLDSGVINEFLSNTFYSILSYAPQAYPNFLPMAQWQKKGNTLTIQGGFINTWEASGNFAHVTGTGNILSLGTSPQEGSQKYLAFDDIGVTIQNNDNIKTPQGVDLQIIQGDIVGVFSGEGGVNLVTHLMSNAPTEAATWDSPLQTRQTVLVGPSVAQIQGIVNVPYYSIPPIAMTSDNSNGFISAQESSAGNAWQAFDKNGGTYSALRAWQNNWYYLYLDFPEEYIIDSFYFSQLTPGTIDDIDFMAIQLSPDKVTWTQVAYIDSRGVGSRTVTFPQFTAKYARFGAYNDDQGATWGYWVEATLYGWKKADIPVQTVSALQESLLRNTVYTQINPIMGAAAQGGYTVTASSEKGSGSAWKAFDGTGANFWESTGTTNEWVKMAFPSAVIINRIKLTAPPSLANEMPERWVIQGSSDNTNWVDIKEWIDTDIWAINDVFYFDFINTTAYLFYRIFIKTNQGGAGMILGDVSFQQMPTDAVYGSIGINLSETQTVVTIADGFTTRGQNDFTLALPSNNETVAIAKSAINYIYLRRNPITGQVTYESKQFGPVYGSYRPEYITDIPVLLRGDNIATPNSIVDSYGNKSMTVVGTVTVSTIAKKFGAGSILFSSAGSYVRIPRYMGIANSKWTMDCWWNPQSFTGTQLNIFSFGNMVGLLRYVVGSLKLQVYLSSNGSAWDITAGGLGTKTNFTINTWYYIKMVFTGKRYLVFVDGVQDIEIASSLPLIQTSFIDVGGFNAGADSASGYIDDFRFRPGVADFYGDLTPVVPTAPATFVKPWYFNISQMKGYEIEEGGTLTSVQMLCLGEALAKDATSTNTTTITYAYNGRKNIQWSEFNPITDDWLTLPHNIGTELIIPSINLNSKTATSPYSNQAIIPIEAVGMYGAAAAWGGIPMGKTIDKLNLKIRYPAASSADYVAAYGGSQALATISGDAISVSATFMRAF